MHAQTKTIQNELLKYGKLMGAHANFERIRRHYVQCGKKIRFGSGEPEGFHRATFEEVTRPFCFVQMDLTHAVVMICIKIKRTKLLIVNPTIWT